MNSRPRRLDSLATLAIAVFMVSFANQNAAPAQGEIKASYINPSGEECTAIMSITGVTLDSIVDAGGCSDPGRWCDKKFGYTTQTSGLIGIKASLNCTKGLYDIDWSIYGYSLPISESGRATQNFELDREYSIDTDAWYKANPTEESVYITVSAGQAEVSINTARIYGPKDIDWYPDKAGGQGDNRNTHFDSPLCPPPDESGYPTYSVNTSFLNLVIQDTEFAYQSYGHRIALKRVWNMLPGRSGLFGNGWSFSYESRLINTGGYTGSVRQVKGSGQEMSFKHSSDTTADGVITAVFAPSTAGNFDALTGYFTESSSYFLLLQKGTRHVYRYDYESTEADASTSYRLTSITDRNGNELTLSYNQDGTLGTLSDASARATTFTYDADKHCTSMTTPDGKTATYAYDARGNLVKTVDLIGTETNYSYDLENTISGMTFDGKTTTFVYDSSSGFKRISSVTDANGNKKEYSVSGSYLYVKDARGGTTTYTNDAGNTTYVKDPNGNKSSTAYTNGLPVSRTDAKGSIWTMVYDSRGNMTKRSDPLGNSTAFTYDTNDNLLSVTNALGNTTTYAYDSRNNLVGITSPTGKTTTFAYDAQGKLTSITDANGHVTTSTYDAFGNSLTITDPLGKTSAFGYDPYGISKTSSTNANGSTTHFEYDNNLRLTKVINPYGFYRTYGYGACTEMSFTDENGYLTTVTRDSVFNVTDTTDPLGNVVSRVLDKNGNISSVTDPLFHTTTNTYDASNRLTKTTNPAGGNVSFTLDANSNLTGVLDERAEYSTGYTRFTYDADNLLQTTSTYNTKTYQDRVTRLTRDALGRVTVIRNARGGSTGFSFDQDGRRTGKTYEGSTVAVFGYDSAGNLTSVTDAAGTTTYSFDARNQVIAIEYPDAKTAFFTYDDAGNISTMTYPGNLVVHYTYDSNNRINTVSWDTNTVTFTYDGVGNLLSEARTNGTETDYAYDANNRFTEIDHRKGASSFAKMNLVRDAVGNTVSETSTLPIYPALTAGSTVGTYGDVNQMVTWGSDAYTYDNDGNLTGITGSRTLTAVYDNENRPTSMTLNGVSISYVYDGLGNRTKAVRGSETRNYHYDHMGRLLFETDGSGSVLACYMYKGTGLAGLKESGASYFYHFDKTGNTLALTGSAGTVVNAYAYTPYGALANRKGSLYNPFTYVGAFGVVSEGDDFYFMKNRYYDAVTGRFIQSDPIGFAAGQTNLYAYANNNPIRFIDPEGLEDRAGFKFDLPLYYRSEGEHWKRIIEKYGTDNRFYPVFRNANWHELPSCGTNSANPQRKFIVDNPFGKGGLFVTVRDVTERGKKYQLFEFQDILETAVVKRLRENPQPQDWNRQTADVVAGTKDTGGGIGD